MDTRHLVSVEKWTLAFAALAVVTAVITVGGRMAFGVTLGALLMCLNAYALRRIGQRAFRTFKKPGATVLLFNLKMALLLALIYFVIRYLPVDPVGFIIGITIFPAAIVATAIRHGLGGLEGETHG